jgi:hypothetical protein
LSYSRLSGNWQREANNAPQGAAELAEGRIPTKKNSQQCAHSQTCDVAPAGCASSSTKEQAFNNLFTLIDDALLTES